MSQPTREPFCVRQVTTHCKTGRAPVTRPQDAASTRVSKTHGARVGTSAARFYRGGQ